MDKQPLKWPSELSKWPVALVNHFMLSHSAQPCTPDRWQLRFFILPKGWSTFGHPVTWQKKGPFLSGLEMQVLECSHMLFLTLKLLLQNGQEKVLSISGQSTPWATLWCCNIPCFDLYGLAQTGQETCFPLTQDDWWNFNIFLEAKTLPHLSQGNFSPQCTPMCFIRWWWVMNFLSHKGHSVASLAMAGSWYGTSAVSLAKAPSGRSSPCISADTCCLTCRRALFLTRTWPPVRCCCSPWSWFQFWPLHNMPSSGNPLTPVHTLSLILGCQAHQGFIFGVWRDGHVSTWKSSAGNTQGQTWGYHGQQALKEKKSNQISDH